MMQLPPDDEIVLVSGIPPVRAKKARYYQDTRFRERLLPPPTPVRPETACADDWSGHPLPLRPEVIDPTPAEDSKDDEDQTGSEHRQQPELSRTRTVEKKEPLDDEFSPDIEDTDDDTARIDRMNKMMRGIARQASLDPADGIDL